MSHRAPPRLPHHGVAVRSAPLRRREPSRHDPTTPAPLASATALGTAAVLLSPDGGRRRVGRLGRSTRLPATGRRPTVCRSTGSPDVVARVRATARSAGPPATAASTCDRRSAPRWSPPSPVSSPSPARSAVDRVVTVTDADGRRSSVEPAGARRRRSVDARRGGQRGSARSSLDGSHCAPARACTGACGSGTTTSTRSACSPAPDRWSCSRSDTAATAGRLAAQAAVGHGGARSGSAATVDGGRRRALDRSCPGRGSVRRARPRPGGCGAGPSRRCASGRCATR